MSDTRTRFLREIAERLPPSHVEEVHLFTPLRQGGLESGVAVVAARPEPAPPDDAGIAPPGEPPEPPDDSWLTTDPPIERGTDLPDDEASTPDEQRESASAAPARLTIYSAHYRLQLKGPDRGKWEFDLSAEADAPAVTVDDVVRGVVRRSGDAMEPERLGGDAFRAALVEEPWTAAR
jgi:hypothetical protein